MSYLKDIRIKNNIKQIDASKKYNTHQPGYHRLEKKDVKDLTLEQAIKISSAIKVSMSELIRQARKEVKEKE